MKEVERGGKGWRVAEVGVRALDAVFTETQLSLLA